MRQTVIEFPYSANAHKDGHSFRLLTADTLRKNNTTGANGVYKKGNKYVAKIVLGGRQIQLGIFPNADAATAARIIVNSIVERDIAPAYDAWFQKASADPAWAAKNPFRVLVVKIHNSLPRFTCNYPI